MTEQLLPPLSKASRQLLDYLADDSVLMVGDKYRKVLRPDGRLNLTFTPKDAAIAGLLKRNLIRTCAVNESHKLFTVAYEITPEGRVAHEALARRV